MSSPSIACRAIDLAPPCPQTVVGSDAATAEELAALEQAAAPVLAEEPATPEFNDSSGDDAATRFEDALLSMDTATIVTQKRMRENDVEGRRLLRKAPGEAFPFHESVSVLNAALNQVAILCGSEVPAYFDLSSDPRRVGLWVSQTIMASQRAQFALGQEKERAHTEPRFAPATALQIMRCCTRMNELLSTNDYGH